MQTVRKIAAVALVVLGVMMIVAAAVLARISVAPTERLAVAQPRPPTPPPPAPPLPTGSRPPHGAITFDEPIGGGRRPGSELAFLGADESVRRMTNATALHRVAGDAAWSADGEHVAFVLGRPNSWRFTGDGDLYVMNADGSDLRRLTTGIGVTSPTWSPDGARLAFVRNQGTALCTIRSEGSGFRVIASAHGYYQNPRWSPAGDLIMYQSQIGHGELGARTFTIHPDGTGERVLPPAFVEGSFPSWSPDGSRLAYAVEASRIGIFDLESGRTDVFTRCSSCYGDMFPAWSPDGKQIAFVREDRQTHWSLYIIDLATGNVSRLGPPGTQQFAPAWRP